MNRYIFSITILFLLSLTVYGQWEWVQLESMPTPRYGHGSVVLGDSIYVIGGATNGRNALRTVDMYDPSNNRWIGVFSEMNYPRMYFAAVCFKGNIFVFGGRNLDTLESTVEVYTPANNRWQVISRMPTPREGLSAVVMDSSVWIIGGQAISAEQAFTLVERFNLTTGVWDTLDHSLQFRRVGACAAVIRDTAYVFGGIFHGLLASYEKYIPDIGWIVAGDMSYACGAAACAVIDDRVFLIGGQGKNGKTQDTIQRFTPVGSPNWQLVDTALTFARKNLSVVGYQNSILVFGGEKDTGQTGPPIGIDLVERLDLVNAIETVDINIPRENQIRLMQNYPNPFNDATSFRVFLPVSTPAYLDVKNILGQSVRQIFSGQFSGWRDFRFDGRDNYGKTLSSGIYFIYLNTSFERRVIKILYSK
ncbi:MAG: T9SS type A sorting domain-containing protein [Calditrichales bacterium]|nr:MAG: T9SS type A sorting domain-containing protein [Calditrichales bacterium]